MEIIDNILAKHFACEELTAHEIELLNQWRTLHADEYVRLERLCTPQEMQISSVEFAPNTEAAWQKVKARCNAPTIGLWHRFGAIAGIAATMLILLGLGYYFMGGPGSYCIHTAGDSSEVLAMADGSTITLNSHASVKYKRLFARHREVELKGEAFFDVTKDAAHPFTIGTSQGRVQVVGTSFTVQSRSEETVVRVRTGKVLLHDHRGDSLSLTPGMEGRLTRHGMETRSFSSQNFTAWHERRLVFDNTPLSEVVADLRSYYNVTIRTRGDMDNYSVTTTFTSESLSEALAELKQLLHIDYKINQNQVLITAPSCAK